MCRSSYYTPCIRYAWHRTHLLRLYLIINYIANLYRILSCLPVSIPPQYKPKLRVQLPCSHQHRRHHHYHSDKRVTEQYRCVSFFLFFFTCIRINCNMLLVLVLCYVLLFQWTNGEEENELDTATAYDERCNATHKNFNPRKSFIIIKYLRFFSLSLSLRFKL